MRHDSSTEEPKTDPPSRIRRLAAEFWKRTGISGAVVVMLLAVAMAFRGGVPIFGAGWDLAKVTLVFALIVVLLRHRVSVGVVLLAAALVLGLLFEVAWSQIGHVFTYGVFSSERTGLHGHGKKALVLIVAIYLINVMGRTMSAAGGLDRVIESLARLVRDVRYVLAIIPAIIGLMPMPGGALLSAPFVGKLGERLNLDSEMKTLANYWFRHVWEYCWPLYPGLIIASQLLTDPSAPQGLRSSGQLWRLLCSLAPMTLAAILIGWLFYLRRIEHRRAENDTSQPAWRDLRRVAGVVWPVIVVTAAVLLGRLGPNQLSGLFFLGALLLVDPIFMVTRRLPRKQIVAVLRASVTLRLVLLVAAVFVLMGMVGVSGAANGLGVALNRYAIPHAVVAFALPFVMSLLTGWTAATVGPTFPFLIESHVLSGAPTIMLAYVGAMLGVLLSPVHLCLGLTREYYGADLRRVYRGLAAPVFCMAVAAAGLALLL